MPFIPAKYLDWTTDGCHTPSVSRVSSYMPYGFTVLRSHGGRKVLYMVLPFAGWLSHVWYHQQETAYSLESMIAGFYMLLLFSLFSKRPAVRILALMLCLLSRYSVVLWIPLYILVMYRNQVRWPACMTVYGVVILLVLYVIPFLIHDPSIFSKAMPIMTKAAWQNGSRQNQIRYQENICTREQVWLFSFSSTVRRNGPQTSNSATGPFTAYFDDRVALRSTLSAIQA